MVKRLTDATNKALAANDLLQKYNEQGVEPRDWSGDKFDAFYKAEIARWAKVVKIAGIVPCMGMDILLSGKQFTGCGRQMGRTA